MSNSTRSFKRHSLVRQLNNLEWPYTGTLGGSVKVPFLMRLKILFFGNLAVNYSFLADKNVKIGPAEVSIYVKLPVWLERIKAGIVKYLKRNAGI